MNELVQRIGGWVTIGRCDAVGGAGQTLAENGRSVFTLETGQQGWRSECNGPHVLVNGRLEHAVSAFGLDYV